MTSMLLKDVHDYIYIIKQDPFGIITAFYMPWMVFKFFTDLFLYRVDNGVYLGV